ncbi:MAG TPA: cbb3-type cytochrome c oxidase subunit I, partial [Steroidobacteraceae bacterium]
MSPLEQTWADQPGLFGALSTVNHKRVAMRYIVTTLVFFTLAGALAMIMRTQLLRSGNDLVGPDAYNQLFSMHGSAMMFLFAVPVMEAVALYLLPLMLGTRTVPFPRLNAYGYWLFLFGGIMSFTVFFLNIGPEAGWFSYVPLAGPEYSPGKRQDFWAQLITFTEVAALIGAIQIITMVFKMRAPGMTLSRMPMFAWAMVATSFMIVFA